MQWHCQIRKKGFPPQTKTFLNRADAEDWAKVIESEMDRGLFLNRSESESTTFDETAKRFKSEFAPEHYRVRADGREAWRFQLAHLVSFFGEYALAAITPALVSQYREARLKVVVGSTVRKELYLLSKIFTVVIKEFGMTLANGNPCTNVRMPKEEGQRDRRLTEDEMQRLLDACAESRCALLLPIVKLALATAMRQGEILALKRTAIDMKRRFVMLLDSETKNGSSRAVPLTTAAIEVLSELLDRKEKMIPLSNKDRLFTIQRDTLGNAFRTACKQAAIADFHFHDLRHEAISRLAERGDLSLLEMAAVSGHKTLAMLQRYTHLQAEKLAAKLG